MNDCPFLDAVKEHLNVRTDLQLAEELGCSRHTLTAIRSGEPVSYKIQIRTLEATNWSLWEMRAKMRRVV